MEVKVGLSLKMTSLIDDIIDWPLPNKIIDSTTARQSYYFCCDKKWFHVLWPEVFGEFEKLAQRSFPNNSAQNMLPQSFSLPADYNCQL